MPVTRPGRATAGLLAVAVTIAAAGAAISLRSSAAEAHRAELAAASSNLHRDVSQLRTAIATPTHAAQETTASLQVLVAEAITGSDRQAAAVTEDVQQATDRLRRHADGLEAAADQPLPARPDPLPVAGVDPLFSRLSPLDDQVRDVADQLRRSAETVDALTTAAGDLHAAAADYAAATKEDLPEGDAPDAHATAWRNELDRLADYRAAIDTAAEVDGLAELAAAHGGLVDALETLATDALAALEAGDIDAYNARTAQGIGEDTIATWREQLNAGADAALAASAVQELERARGQILGLLDELDNIRHSSTTAVAVG